MAIRKKSGLVPPTLHYCGHNAKKIGPKKYLLKICTLHTLIRCTKRENLVQKLIYFLPKNKVLKEEKKNIYICLGLLPCLQPLTERYVFLSKKKGHRKVYLCSFLYPVVAIKEVQLYE